MVEVKYITEEDKEFWFSLDKHLAESEFHNIVNLKRGYVIFEDDKPIGILRYNLCWDSIPFCTMLYISWDKHNCGFGKKIMTYWEEEMKSLGHGMIMTSTQVDETSQHFYRKLGFKDAGGIIMEIPGYEQPMEMIMVKAI